MAYLLLHFLRQSRVHKAILAQSDRFSAVTGKYRAQTTIPIISLAKRP